VIELLIYGQDLHLKPIVGVSYQRWIGELLWNLSVHIRRSVIDLIIPSPVKRVHDAARGALVLPLARL